jgi:hypothetical protein
MLEGVATALPDNAIEIVARDADKENQADGAYTLGGVSGGRHLEGRPRRFAGEDEVAAPMDYCVSLTSSL